MQSVIQLLLEQPLLLLFLVAAVGYPLGQIKFGGSSLGVAAVLFVGIVVGSLHPGLRLPDVVYLLGLALFVYTIGLSSGPGFLVSLRRQALRDNLLVVGVLLLAAIFTVTAHRLLRLRPELAAGIYAGSLTNTPALASILDYVKGHTPRAALDQALADPVLGFSLAVATIAKMLVAQAMLILMEAWPH